MRAMARMRRELLARRGVRQSHIQRRRRFGGFYGLGHLSRRIMGNGSADLRAGK